MSTVYTVAFSGSDFLMVYNPKRNGWEMPGGRIEKGESAEDAAAREYLEESGYRINIVAAKEIDGCRVFAASLGDRKNEGEFASELFSFLPDELAFERSEYDHVLGWARSVIEKFGR